MENELDIGFIKPLMGSKKVGSYTITLTFCFLSCVLLPLLKTVWSTFGILVGKGVGHRRKRCSRDIVEKDAR